MINRLFYLPLNKLKTLCLAIFLMLIANVLHAQNIQIDGARLWRAPDNTRLVFDVSGSFTYRTLILTEPSRIAIDVNASNIKPKLAELDLSNTPIKVIRSSQSKDNIRIVLDLSAAVTPKIFALAPNQTYGHRLVVDLFDVIANTNTNENQAVYDVEQDIKNVIAQINAEHTNQTSNQTPLSPTKKGNLDGVKPHLPPIDSKITTSPPNKNSNVAVTTKVIPKTENKLSRLDNDKQDIVIAVDAGHGGDDPGALGPRGQQEKHIVLNIAKEVQREINTYTGFKAVLTRTGDYFIPLPKRAQIARSKGAKLFVSIHADAAPKRSAFGASVYAVSQKGATSETAKWLADSENRSDLIGGVDSKNKMLTKVILGLSMENSMLSSLNVGQKVLNKMGAITPLHKKRVEQAAFIVLKNPDMPSILVETGFISNHSESQKLTTKEHQVRLAKSISAGIVDFFRQNPPPNTYVAWQRDNGKLPKPAEHIVVAGDNLAKIAGLYNISIVQLKNINKLQTDTLKVGQVLKLP